MTTHTSKCHAVRHLTMLKNSKSIYIQKYDATYSSPMTIRQQICQSLHCHVILSFFSFLFPLVSLCFLPPSSISFFAQSKKAHLFPRIFLQNHDITHSWSPTSLTAYPNEPPPLHLFKFKWKTKTLTWNRYLQGSQHLKWKLGRESSWRLCWLGPSKSAN